MASEQNSMMGTPKQTMAITPTAATITNPAAINSPVLSPRQLIFPTLNDSELERETGFKQLPNDNEALLFIEDIMKIDGVHKNCKGLNDDQIFEFTMAWYDQKLNTVKEERDLYSVDRDKVATAKNAQEIAVSMGEELISSVHLVPGRCIHLAGRICELIISIEGHCCWDQEMPGF